MHHDTFNTHDTDKGSEHMRQKQITDPERKRKQVYIHDELYKKVSVKAAEQEVDKGKVIEEALKQYFGGEGRQG
jgi:hypothetical protein